MLTLNDVNSLTVGGSISGISRQTVNRATALNGMPVWGKSERQCEWLISDNASVAVAGTKKRLYRRGSNDILLNDLERFRRGQ